MVREHGSKDVASLEWLWFSEWWVSLWVHAGTVVRTVQTISKRTPCSALTSQVSLRYSIPLRAGLLGGGGDGSLCMHKMSEVVSAVMNVCVCMGLRCIMCVIYMYVCMLHEMCMYIY